MFTSNHYLAYSIHPFLSRKIKLGTQLLNFDLLLLLGLLGAGKGEWKTRGKPVKVIDKKELIWNCWGSYGFVSSFCWSIVWGIVPGKGLLFSIDEILKISHDYIILPSFLRPRGTIYVTVTGIGVNRLLNGHHDLFGLSSRSTRYNRVHFTKRRFRITQP